MHSLISSKIKMRKQHTTQLSSELLHKARVALKLPDSFINFNEWLPSDVLRLRTTVGEAAREHGCTTFVRDGRIYIKLKKEDRAVKIASDKDLKDFLGSITAN
ncbi:hypothetical protein TSAR_007547 [Trichomalopsis sarcophagae]|uniref:Uncharacterized protein n=1 Tax=Trichomalopsis sarcophagae TaxID=543379 RepID=A0A232ET06_9HYME|nr:hypothetical protein TSAR_007547 [Trichomalopsis sarcophagae]